MLNDVDLEQQGSVLWWPEGQLPTKEHPEWGGRNNQFNTLRAAIDFVMQLSEPEQKQRLSPSFQAHTTFLIPMCGTILQSTGKRQI
jgi:hypothetical protein